MTKATLADVSASTTAAFRVNAALTPTMDGGRGVDEVSYTFEASNGGTRGITANLTTGKATDSFGKRDTLKNIENLFGGDRNDVLRGSVGANSLTAGGGNDKVSGGYGNDKLSGGSGQDVFLFNSKLSNTGNVDRVTDFFAADDAIRLENSYFTGIKKTGALASSAFWAGSKAHDANDRIIYNQKTGILHYDRDGTGSAVAIKFAKLNAGTEISHKDFFII